MFFDVLQSTAAESTAATPWRWGDAARPTTAAIPTWIPWWRKRDEQQQC